VRGRLEQELVGITPTPVLARLEALHNGVPSGTKMFSRMLVGRRIATADMAAGKAEAKMNPLTPGLETLFTTLRGHRMNWTHLF
jgi:hypothetical protein